MIPPKARLACSAALLAVAAIGCGDTTGAVQSGLPFDDVAGFSGTPIMNPGFDCLACHGAGERASRRTWTIAGTVFSAPGALPDGGLAGAEVLLTDVSGKTLALRSNAAGNFYTSESLGTLSKIEVQRGSHRLAMNLGVVGGGALDLVGSCNRCHTVEGETPPLGIGGAPGRLYVPGP